MANNNHFNLTLDTIAPTGSAITLESSIVNGTAKVKFSATDKVAGESTPSGTPTLMKVWADANDGTNSHPTSEPNSSWIAYENHSSSFYSVTLPNGDGTYYVHVMYMDDVGNKSTISHSAGITCDRTAPTVSAFTITDPSVVSPQTASSYTNNLTNNVSVIIADNEGGTGIAQVKFTCTAFANDIVASATSSPYTGTISFKDGTTAGTYTVTAYVKDAAGNWSSGKTYSIIYDPDKAAANLELHKTSSYNGVVPADVTSNANFSSVSSYLASNADIYARIDVTSPNGSSSDVIGYKI